MMDVEWPDSCPRPRRTQRLTTDRGLIETISGMTRPAPSHSDEVLLTRGRGLEAATARRRGAARPRTQRSPRMPLGRLLAGLVIVYYAIKEARTIHSDLVGG
jgi:hypothetical protein